MAANIDNIEPKPATPQLGQIVKVYGNDCRIVKIHAFGTIDVVRADGKAFRLSGLAF